MAIESKPADPKSFKVVHHFTTNLVEDPEEDPVGLFLNEYALGKNGDVFPPELGTADQGRHEDQLQPASQPARRGNAGVGQARAEGLPEGQCAEVRRLHAAHGRCTGPRHPGRHSSRATTATSACRSRRCWRRSSRTCTTAARRSASKRSTPTSGRTRLGPVPPASRRSRCVSNYQFGWHITYPYADDVAPLLPAGTIVHVISWHDNTSAQQVESEPEELGRLRPTIDRRDELRLGDAHLPRSG